VVSPVVPGRSFSGFPWQRIPLYPLVLSCRGPPPFFFPHRDSLGRLSRALSRYLPQGMRPEIKASTKYALPQNALLLKPRPFGPILFLALFQILAPLVIKSLPSLPFPAPPPNVPPPVPFPPPLFYSSLTLFPLPFPPPFPSAHPPRLHPTSPPVTLRTHHRFFCSDVSAPGALERFKDHVVSLGPSSSHIVL